MHTYCITAFHNTHKECFKFMTYIRLYVLAVQVIDIGISYCILLHLTRTTLTDTWFRYPYTLKYVEFSEGTMGALNKYCMKQYWRSSYCISSTPYMHEDSFYCHFWVSTVKFNFTPKWSENIRITTELMMGLQVHYITISAWILCGQFIPH